LAEVWWCDRRIIVGTGGGSAGSKDGSWSARTGSWGTAGLELEVARFANCGRMLLLLYGEVMPGCPAPAEAEAEGIAPGPILFDDEKGGRLPAT